MAICCLTHVRYMIQLLSKLTMSQKAEGGKKLVEKIVEKSPSLDRLCLSGSYTEKHMEGYGGKGGAQRGRESEGGKNNRPRSLSPPSPIRASSFQSRHSWAIICLSVDLICHFNYLSVCVSFVNVCAEGKRSCV